MRGIEDCRAPNGLAATGIPPRGLARHCAPNNNVMPTLDTQECPMIRTIFAAAAVAALATSFSTSAGAQGQGQGQERLLIVNGNTGHVVYDDGRDDLFCVTRRYVKYYNYHGRPVYRRTMRCR
jgi:hypothetical protein